MDPEQIEEFFKLHLSVAKIKHGVKERIYSIKFTKKDADAFGKEVTCTFNQDVAQKKKVPFVGKGTFLLDSIVGRYLNGMLCASIKILPKENDLMDLNELLPDLNKGSVSYRIDDADGVGTYVLFEVSIKSAETRKRIMLPLLLTKEFITEAKGFENNTFEDNPQDVVIDATLFADKLGSLLKGELDALEASHEKKINELVEIVLAHGETQYNEVQKNEGIERNKIAMLKEQVVSASSFTQKNNLNDKIKKHEKKLTALIEKNQKRRNEIKKQHDAEIEAIRKRAFLVEATPICVAAVEFSMFCVNFDDKTRFYYLPAIKKFVKKA